MNLIIFLADNTPRHGSQHSTLPSIKGSVQCISTVIIFNCPSSWKANENSLSISPTSCFLCTTTRVGTGSSLTSASHDTRETTAVLATRFTFNIPTRSVFGFQIIRLVNLSELMTGSSIAYRVTDRLCRSPHKKSDAV